MDLPRTGRHRILKEVIILLLLLLGRLIKPKRLGWLLLLLLEVGVVWLLRHLGCVLDHPKQVESTAASITALGLFQLLLQRLWLWLAEEVVGGWLLLLGRREEVVVLLLLLLLRFGLGE